MRGPCPTDCCAHVHTHVYAQVFALGTQQGVLVLLDCAERSSLKLLHFARMHTAPIAFVAYSPRGRLLLTGTADGELALLDSSPTHAHAIELIAYASLGTPLSAAVWLDAEEAGAGVQLMLATTAKGLVRLVVPPLETLVDGRDEGRVVPLELLSPLSMTLDTSLTALGVLCADPIELVGLGVDKCLHKFEVPAADADGAGAIHAAKAATAPLRMEPLDGQHEKRGSVLAVSADRSVLATAASDGRAIVRRLGVPGEGPLVSRVHDSQLGGVAAGVFIDGGAALVTVGLDSAIFITQVDVSAGAGAVCERAQHNPIDAVAGADVDGDDERMALPYMQFKTKQEKAALSDPKEQLSQMRTTLKALKQRFQDLLVNNSLAPELEQLERSDFTIDLALQEQLYGAGGESVQAVREEIKMKNLEQDLLWQRIKESCYDAMLVPSVTITSIVGSAPTKDAGAAAAASQPALLMVSNFPLMRLSPGVERRQTDVQTIRRVETSNWRALKAAGEADGIFAADVPVVKTEKKRVEAKDAAAAEADGKKKDEPKAAELKRQTTTAQGKAGQAEGEAAEPEDAEAEEADDDELLYSGYMLDCPERKRTQMVLLSIEVRQLQEGFNAEFSRAMEHKQKELEKIEEKNKRISEILDELKLSEELLVPVIAECEEPTAVLKVQDSDFLYNSYGVYSYGVYSYGRAEGPGLGLPI